MGADCSKEGAVVAKRKYKDRNRSSAVLVKGGGKRKSISNNNKSNRTNDSVPRTTSPSPSPSSSRCRSRSPSTPSPRWDKQSKAFQASNYNFAHERATSSIESALQERSTSVGVVGLRNMGNTCYMSSSLQCLSMTIPLADYFIGEAYRREINTSNHLGSKGKLVQAFAKLMRSIWIDAPSSGVIRPASFKNELDNFAPQFQGRKQHDAQELLSILLDGIHEDLNRVKKKPYIEYKDCDGTNDAADAAEAWKNYLQRDKSVIVDIFQGQLRNHLTCLCCGHQNIRFEAVMYLSLPIDDTCKTLDDCLRLFLKEERLTGDNQWYCSKCKKHCDATKKIDLWILPPILIVHFKRFRTNEFGLVASKNNAAVRFPLQDWMVGSFIKNKDGFAPRYDLYAVANHMGQIGQGHYTAYGLHRMDDQWYEFNDSNTRPIDPKEIESNRSNAYVLFYNRVEDGDSNHSNGSSERSAPLIRRQSVSRPDLWPHAQVIDNRYRSFSRSSQRSGSTMIFADSPISPPSNRRRFLPPRNEVIDTEDPASIEIITSISAPLPPL